MKTGILLIGHGTRDAAGVREFLELGKLLAAQAAPLPVSSCFLELAEPSIAVGIGQLLQSGIQRVLVAPLLLFSAGHHQRDVPEAVRAALAAYPGIETAQLPALNDHPRVLALSQRRLEEARRLSSTAAEADAGNRLLLLVGRGSSDAAASARLRDFAAQRAVAAGIQSVLSCFVHGQVPSLATGLQLAETSSTRTVLVQPHLLFQGLVFQEIEAAVQKIAESSNKDWRLAEPLGPDPDIARAVLELAAPWLK